MSLEVCLVDVLIVVVVVECCFYEQKEVVNIYGRHKVEKLSPFWSEARTT